jgi:beta-lactamase class A
MTTEDELQRAFDAAGVAGALHAVDIDSGAEVGHRADEPSVLASVFKVPVLVALLRAADEGSLDLAEQVTVPVADRAPGPTGLSVMADPVTMSWRDLARSMIVVSDNAATDVVMERVGVAQVDATLQDLGISDASVTLDCRGLFATVLEDSGLASLEALPQQPTRAELDSWRATRPRETNWATPRAVTQLLSLIWTDKAASPESCELARQILLQQVWPHRLASGFPEDDVATGGKTGTLPSLRNEAGVVLWPDGRRFAVAVFTRAEATTAKHAAADAVIGRAARIAVDALRQT